MLYQHNSRLRGGPNQYGTLPTGRLGLGESPRRANKLRRAAITGAPQYMGAVANLALTLQLQPATDANKGAAPSLPVACLRRSTWRSSTGWCRADTKTRCVGAMMRGGNATRLCRMPQESLPVFVRTPQGLTGCLPWLTSTQQHYSQLFSPGRHCALYKSTCSLHKARGIQPLTKKGVPLPKLQSLARLGSRAVRRPRQPDQRLPSQPHR